MFVRLASSPAIERIRASDCEIRNRRLEQVFERFDFTGKAAALVALHDGDDFSEFGLIPLLPRRFVCGVTFFPVVHVEPLDVADAWRRLHLALALDEDGLDVAAFDTDGDGDFVEADAGVAGGMLREERQHAVALQNAVGDGAPPFVAELDLALVEPDIVTAFFQVGLDAAHQLLIAVVAIAEEDPHGGYGFFQRYLSMFGADPEFADLRQRLTAFRALNNICHGLLQRQWRNVTPGGELL